MSDSASTTTADSGQTTTVTVAATSDAGSDLKTLFSTALATLRGKQAVAADLVAAQAQLATVTAERDTARTDLATVRAELATASGQVSAIAGFFGLEAAAFAGKAPKDALALITAKVSALAADQVAALGFAEQKLPGASTSEAGHDYGELLREYSQIADSQERAAFYATRIAPLAAKAAAADRN